MATNGAEQDWFVNPTGQVQQIASQLKRLTYDEAVYIGSGLAHLANFTEVPPDLASVLQAWASRIVKAPQATQPTQKPGMTGLDSLDKGSGGGYQEPATNVVTGEASRPMAFLAQGVVTDGYGRLVEERATTLDPTAYVPRDDA
jgi:hypothetical protein